MSVILEIIQARNANPQASQVVLSHDKLAGLSLEASSLYRQGIPMSVAGLAISLAPPTDGCRNCGAEPEPQKCSYCGSPASFIEVK